MKNVQVGRESQAFPKRRLRFLKSLLILAVGMGLQSSAFIVVAERAKLTVASGEFDHPLSAFDGALVSLQALIGLGHPKKALGRFFVAHFVSTFEALQGLVVLMPLLVLTALLHFIFVSKVALRGSGNRPFPRAYRRRHKHEQTYSQYDPEQAQQPRTASSSIESHSVHSNDPPWRAFDITPRSR